MRDETSEFREEFIAPDRWDFILAPRQFMEPNRMIQPGMSLHIA